MSDDTPVDITVPPEAAGQRLDRLVSEHVAGCSRSLAADLIRDGHLLVGGTVRKPGYRPRTGERIHGVIPRPAPARFGPEAIDIDILFEDAHLMFLNKPPGLVVHPAPGHDGGTLVNALLHHIPDLRGIGGELRPGIVHRLDKDTSGVLVVAKSAEALARLAVQFKSREIRKQYTALIHGHPAGPAGRVDLPIGRHPVERKRMAVNTPRSRPAETLWSVTEWLPETALVDIDLKTGRTHQIRVHLAALGHPVVGDPVYGSGQWGSGQWNRRHSPAIRDMLLHAGRQMLHARRLILHHPLTGDLLDISAPLPSDFLRLTESLRAVSGV